MDGMSRIQVLPELLVRKIAAGEVVERPASVVKELVENAVDAEATRIAVTIEDGGRQLIRVTDDGAGMTADELRLAVTPHATSKVRVEEDLYDISTMGFRGEALASISAVSKMRLVSRVADQVEAHELRVVAEQVESSMAAGAPPGTTIEVRDLFFNVPARRKFLRTPSTEVGHINEQLTRVALPNPQIGFELTNNKRVTQNLPRCDSRRERIAKVYGPELASALMHAVRDERGVRIEAFLAPPTQSRATAQWQYAFVNGRYVRDKHLMHATKEAYRGLTEPTRHAVVFLFIDLDPRSVDVNVHPTKIEVRWVEGNLIHSQVLSVLRETLQEHDLTPALSTVRASRPVDPVEQDRVRRETAAWLRSENPMSPTDRPTYDGAGVLPPSRAEGRRANFPAPREAMAAWEALYRGAEPRPGDDADRQAPGEVMVPGRADLPDGDFRGRAVQMHNLYLVVETDEGILIVDQHALHERVMYEQLKARIATDKLESQRLLLPETVSVSAEEAATLEEHRDLLDRLGIEVTSFGTDSVAVQSFPSVLRDGDVASFLRNLLDTLAGRSGETGTDVVLNDLISMMACKAAVKAGDPLTQEEIDALMKKRHLIEKSVSCPHGRPTMLRLTKADLNRQFHRT